MPGVVGIDAGGSHTRAVRVATDGTVMATGAGGPANTFFTPPDEARANIAAAARAVLADGPPPGAGCLTGPNLPPDALGLLEAAAPDVQWMLVTEDAACRAAVFGDADAPGCIVLCGTGTFAAGRWPSGVRVRRGGWGPLVGDEGSGTLIALDALRAVVRAAETLAPRTALTEAMLDACGLQRVDELKGFLYQPLISRSRLAALCPAVARVAADGDAVALDILHTAGLAVAELAASVLLASEAPGPDIATALFGGVLQHIPPVADACKEHLAARVPETDVRMTALHPVDGAIAVALQAAHTDPAAALQAIERRRLEEQEVPA